MFDYLCHKIAIICQILKTRLIGHTAHLSNLFNQLNQYVLADQVCWSNASQKNWLSPFQARTIHVYLYVLDWLGRHAVSRQKPTKLSDSVNPPPWCQFIDALFFFALIEGSSLRQMSVV